MKLGLKKSVYQKRIPALTVSNVPAGTNGLGEFITNLKEEKQNEHG